MQSGKARRKWRESVNPGSTTGTVLAPGSWVRGPFPGYAPWTKKVYLKDESMQLTAVLSGGGRRR